MKAKLADRTKVFPHPPGEPWTPPWWNPRVTAALFVVGLIAFFSFSGLVGGVMMRHRNADQRRFAASDMELLVAPQGAKHLPGSRIDPLSRKRLIDLDELYGPVIRWHVELVYCDVFGVGGAAVVFEHRRGGDMRLDFYYGANDLLSVTGNAS
ncbi:MAG: hypothetical protein ACYC96_12580 [Fimbriimonadaceae bacterium]